jgi:hypothetical protein
VHGLGQAPAGQLAQAAEEYLAIRLGQDREDVLANAVEYLLDLAELVLSGRGHHDEPGPAIGAQGSALSQAGGFQLVERDHHRGLVDPHQPREIGLSVLASSAAVNWVVSE